MDFKRMRSLTQQLQKSVKSLEVISREELWNRKSHSTVKK